MKQKLCPHCGASSPADTRFCRVCGASLRYVGEDDSLASPLDKTVPFTRNLPETTELSNLEIERAVAAPHAADSLLPVDDEATLISDNVAPREAAQTLAATSELTRAQATSPVNFNDLPAAREHVPIVEDDTPLAQDALRANLDERLEAAQIADPERTLVASSATRMPTPKPNHKGWLWWTLASTCVAVVAAGSMLVALNLYSRRSADTANASATDTLALNPQAESLRLTEEAEKLIAAQDFDAGVARLREAVQLDERNARAQLQLGTALERTGKRNEAIFFYEATAALTPNDPLVWRQLAGAQLAENRFADAVQSYRRLFALTANNAAGEAVNGVVPASLPNDETLRFRYAEALRGAGETAQARELFAQLVASITPAIKSAAQAQLALINNSGDAFAQATDTDGLLIGANTDQEISTQTSPSEGVTAASSRDVTIAANADDGVSIKPTSTRSSNTATPNTAERRLTAQERYERAVNLYSSNRASALTEFSAVADAMPDAHYYLGLARTEGIAPRAMHRAELLAALTHFQIAAQRGTRHAAQAAARAEQLGLEYDRRRKG